MNRLYCLLALLFSLTAPAQEVLQFDNEAQRQLYQQLTAELRCPQCQNQNIADSHAVVAVDMRQKTYQLIREGKDRQQVLEYMINRYGDFVHYLPPVNRYTLWLWLLPLLMLVLLLAAGLYRRSRQLLPDDAGEPHKSAAELDQLIARYRSKKP